MGLLFGLGSTLVAAASPALADEDHQLVVNGDFASGAEGWRTNNPTQLLDVLTEAGASVAELTTSDEQHAVLNDEVNTVADTGAAGQEYVVSARVRTTTPNVNGALRVREVTPDDAISHQSSFWLPNTEWHTVELDLTTSHDNAWLDLNVVAWNLRADQNLQIEVVSMEEGNAAPAPAPQPAPAPAPQPDPAPAPAPEPKPEPKPDPEPAPAPAPEPKPEPAPRPEPNRPTPSDGTLFGTSVSTVGQSLSESLDDIDSAFGDVPVVRHFSSGLPFSWDSQTARQLSDRTLVMSFKAHPTEITSGKHDAFFRNWFRSAPTDQTIYWSYFHEPENNISAGDFTAAQYRAAWTRLAQLADAAGKSNLHSTLILTSWTMNPQSGRDYRTYDAGASAVDVIAFDPYNGIYDPQRDYYQTPEEMLGFIVEKMADDGRPWGIAEIGSRIVVGDNGRGRASWLRDVGEYAAANDALFVTYFHSTRGANWHLRDSASQNAWAELVSG